MEPIDVLYLLPPSIQCSPIHTATKQACVFCIKFGYCWQFNPRFLASAGKAVEMSYDHKPEDEVELTRIKNAGGKVTMDGRVNGGLNLSRAIGIVDLWYDF